jgi:predicted AAA+ superfamily ATPase
MVTRGSLIVFWLKVTNRVFVGGASWEGFVLENLLSALPTGITPWFYRTSAGAEIDLVIEKNSKERYAIQILDMMNELRVD